MFGMTIDIKNMLCQVFDRTHANRCTKKLMLLDVTNMSRYSLCHINYYRITWWWRNNNWEICINKTYCNSHQESISMKQIEQLTSRIKGEILTFVTTKNIFTCSNEEARIPSSDVKNVAKIKETYFKCQPAPCKSAMQLAAILVFLLPAHRLQFTCPSCSPHSVSHLHVPNCHNSMFHIISSQSIVNDHSHCILKCTKTTHKYM